MELAYVFGALGHCPREKLLSLHLPRIDAALEKLQATTPEKYEGGHYWDGKHTELTESNSDSRLLSWTFLEGICAIQRAIPGR